MTAVLSVPRIVVPHINFDFPFRAHTEAELVETHIQAWARKYDLVRSERAKRRLQEARFGYFIACVYPLSRDLMAAAEWNTWLFMFDDQFDDGVPAQQAQQIDELFPEILGMLPLDLGRTPKPSCGLVSAVADWWTATAPAMTRSWRARFVNHVRGYLESYRVETTNRLCRRPPDLADYIELRRSSGAVSTSLDLIEVCSRFSLSDTVVDSEWHRTLSDATNDLICWHNDIVSANKELARGEVNNLVVVLRQARGGEWAESTAEAMNMLDQRWNQYLNAECQVYSVGSSLCVTSEDMNHLLHYVLATKYWIVGSLHWHLTTRRYSDVEYTDLGTAPSYLESLLPAKRAS